VNKRYTASLSGIARRHRRAWVETSHSGTRSSVHTASPAVIGGRGLKLRQIGQHLGQRGASPAVIGGRGLKRPLRL